MSNTDGHDALWKWFGLSRASFLTMPRVMMHAMPDEWQAKMAVLLDEWDAEWDTSNTSDPGLHVSAKVGNRFTAMPDWLLQYRHPDIAEIESRRRAPIENGETRA